MLERITISSPSRQIISGLPISLPYWGGKILEMRGTPEKSPLAGNPFTSVPLLFLAMILPSSMVMISSNPSWSKSPNARDESEEMREIEAIPGEL